jgi:hypothetical protein
MSVPIECSIEKPIGNIKHACTANSFKTWIKERLDISNEVSCETDYVRTGPYADTTDYMIQLFKDIGLVLNDDTEFNIHN